MTCYWLNGATLVDYRMPGQQLFLYSWQRTNNTSLVVAWHLEGGSAPLAATGLTVTDVYGQSVQTTNLTEMPLLFQSGTLSPAALLSNVMAALPNLNLPPVLSQPANQSVLRGQHLQFSISATDPNHNPLTYSASSLPAGASLDSSSGLFTWTPTVNQTGTYTINFTATNDQGMSVSTSATVIVTASLTDGLAHQWHFDEGSGTITADSIGSCAGTLTLFDQDPLGGWVTGVQSNAVNYDGTRSYIKLNDSTLFLTNNFAVSVWLKPRSVSGVQPFLSIHSGYLSSGLRFAVQNGLLDMQGQTTAGYAESLFEPLTLQSNTWYHVVFVYNQSTVNLYINGVNQGSASWGGDVTMDPSLSSYVGTQNSAYFAGVIDDLMIYGRTLNSQEVLQLYQGPPQPPSLTAINPQTVQAGQTLEFTVSGSDANGDPLTYSASPLPSGAVLDAASGVFTWTPRNNQVNSYNVEFIVSDGQLSDSQTVTITVTKPARKPVLKPIKPKRVRAGHSVRIKLSAKNPGHKSLTYSIDPMPADSAFNSLRHKFVWTTTNAPPGTYSLTASVTDGEFTSSQPVSITVY